MTVYGDQHSRACSVAARQLAEKRKVEGLSPAQLRIVVAVTTFVRVTGQAVHQSQVAAFFGRLGGSNGGRLRTNIVALRDAGWLASSEGASLGRRLTRLPILYTPTERAERLCYGQKENHAEA